MRKAKILTTGMYVPDCVVTNDLLAQAMDTSDQWITQRTGIKERRMIPDTYKMLQQLARAPDKEAYLRTLYDTGVDGKIERQSGFSPQMADTERTCSISPGHCNCRAGRVDGVCGVVWVCKLTWWEAAVLAVLFAIPFFNSAAEPVITWIYFGWTALEVARMFVRRRMPPAFPLFLKVWRDHIQLTGRA